jgi:hypothetical protein
LILFFYHIIDLGPACKDEEKFASPTGFIFFLHEDIMESMLKQTLEILNAGDHSKNKQIKYKDSKLYLNYNNNKI